MGLASTADDADGLCRCDREAAMAATLVRVVILQVDDTTWCPNCDLACAVTVVYVEEREGQLPGQVHRLTYCPACDDR
jgi:hypothetical protein